MLDTTIRRLLEMHPRGVSNDQLLWRLRSAGIRVSPSDLLDGLNSLVERGEIRRNGDGRWSAFRQATQASTAKAPSPSASADNSTLYGVLASRRPLTGVAANEASIEPAAERGVALPPASSLLTYYAATQRQDTRGQIEEYADRHGRVWQLFHTRGHWWSDCELTLPMERLPDGFRESLMRRNTRSAAIGWPVSVFVTPAGAACVPALLVPVTWRIDGADLCIQPELLAPSLNPAWLRLAAKHTNWNQEHLGERLLDAEDQSVAAIGDRMRHALATLGGNNLRVGDLAAEMSLLPQGMRNCAALFLSEDASFTKGAAADLETLAAMPATALADTALASVIADLGSRADAVAPIPVSELTDTQLSAAADALASSLSVIQGPPGTGKSQVILNVLASAILSGRSVLFAAKNHQALDEIERRIHEFVGDTPILVRGRDSDGERDTSFLDVLNELARDAAEAGGATRRLDSEITELRKDAEKAAGERQRRRQVERAHLALSDLADRPSVAIPSKPKRPSLFARIVGLFYRLLGRAGAQDILELLPEDATSGAILTRRKALEEFIKDAAGGSAAPEQLIASVMKRAKERLPAYAASVITPTLSEWTNLSDRSRDLDFNRVRRAASILPEDARAIVRHRPIWIMSTLSVPSRIPLVPGLFDYVVFDEASQCDIASALPLLARARRAVVVGDPMQLRFIPGLSNRAEHALMDAAGLPKERRFDFAQSTNSLFDFAHRRPLAVRHFLRDQFRSAPEIVDYLNADFYRGRLINRREDDFFTPPKGYQPGLGWEDVQGHARREDDGTVNADEAIRITGILKRLAADPSFTGSVGVLSPFNAQVAHILREANGALTKPERDSLSLRISTIDKFQGGEADVILFSLVLTDSAPSSARTFLEKERRRLNVAISRARAVCIVVGDLAYAKRCGIRHIQYLAQRASGTWSPARPPFDSLWERRLDTAMRSRGIDAVPQYPVGSRYLDFAIDPAGAMLNIEVDGRKWHVDQDGERKVSDRKRDEEMTARGWSVMRFWVHELADDIGGCIDRIERELERRRAR